MPITDKLTSIANAIREKGGTTEKLTLDAMPTAIAALSTGSGSGEDGVPNPINLTVSMGGLFSNNNWDWVLQNYIDRLNITVSSSAGTSSLFANTVIDTPITFNTPITYTGTDGKLSCSSMFKNSNIILGEDFVNSVSGKLYDVASMFEGYKGETIPSLTFNNTTTYSCNSFIKDCPNLKEIGTIYNLRPSTYCSYMFGSNPLVREYKFEGCDFSAQNTGSYGYLQGLFSRNHSLRRVDSTFLKGVYNKSPTCQLQDTFNSCYALDEVIGLSPQTRTLTSNAFSNTFNYCYHLKNIIFDTQADGTPYIAEWKNQTIDLSIYVGWAGYNNADKHILNYNSGITADKEVIDAPTYAALKDDPDWWSKEFIYSRFNHDSAVNLINSLPDASAYLATQSGATNTVKFKTGAGTNTDSGSVSALTEEEVAVAAAKGWSIGYTT